MRRFASLHAAVAAAALTACNASTSAPALSPAGHTLASHQTALAGPATVVVRNGLTLHLFLTRDAARALPATTNNLLYHGGPFKRLHAST